MSAGLGSEARPNCVFAHKVVAQDLDRHSSIELEIVREVDNRRSATAE